MPNEGVVLKRLARDLSLRHRFERLTVSDLVKSEKLKKVLLVLAFKLGRCDKNEEKEHAEALRTSLRLTYVKYTRLIYHVPQLLRGPRRRDLTIDSFCDSDCYIFFQFKKPHLHELLELLQLDVEEDEMKFDNDECMCGEEILLRGLYELVSGETKHKIARNVFGRDGSSQSRAFSYFINHMCDKFTYLVQGNMQWWYDNNYFELSAKAIGAKLNLENHHNLVSHFIDCNCMETDRVGGGPAEAGANAARWDPDIQRAFYNGWKSMNGLKHQTVDDAYGFTADIFGPTSLRRNDLTLLRESEINLTFARLQLQSDVDYIIFGDSAYKRQSHIRSYFSEAENVAGGQRWNRHMKRLRISIEWNYGHQGSMFKYLNTQFKMKILGAQTTSQVFIATTILRNLHTGFYGSQSSRYFNLDIPENFNYYYVNQMPMRV
jgi:hypothetical protein